MSAWEIRGGDSGILRKIGDIWVRWEVDALSIWVQVSVAHQVFDLGLVKVELLDLEEAVN